jgi:hypothetical protein
VAGRFVRVSLFGSNADDHQSVHFAMRWYSASSLIRIQEKKPGSTSTMPFTHCASQQGSNCELIFRQSTSMCTASRCPLCRENDPNVQCIFNTVQCSAPLHRRAELVHHREQSR